MSVRDLLPDVLARVVVVREELACGAENAYLAELLSDLEHDLAGAIVRLEEPELLGRER